MKPRKITVWWNDACSPSKHWIYPDDIDKKPDRIVTRGWLVADTKRAIVVCHSLSRYQYGNPLTIPKSAIRKRRDK